MRSAIQSSLFDGRRVLVWFSCGAASACAAKSTLQKYPDAKILYCDTLAYEHPDNRRFMADVSAWLGRGIEILRSEKYSDIFDVFNKTGWLVGRGMARCTIELKRAVRERYQHPGDIHVFGYTADEAPRVARFERDNPEINLHHPLIDAGMKKSDCIRMLSSAGIELPAMYRIGYRNNNCVGCVKGKAGYWNKIRVDFPEVFDRMARQERKMNARILDVFLDELQPDRGRYDNDDLMMECGPACGLGVRE